MFTEVFANRNRAMELPILYFQSLIGAKTRLRTTDTTAGKQIYFTCNDANHHASVIASYPLHAVLPMMLTEQYGLLRYRLVYDREPMITTMSNKCGPSETHSPFRRLCRCRRRHTRAAIDLRRRRQRHRTMSVDTPSHSTLTSAACCRILSPPQHSEHCRRTSTTNTM